MKSKLQAWSYSRLQAFEQCPRRFHETSIKKSVPDEENDQARDGKVIHAAFAKAVKDGAPLPLRLTYFEPQMERLRQAPGEKLIEEQLALTAEFKPTGWFDRDVYIRGIVDLAIIAGSRGLVIDYKTGRRYDDFTQLNLTAFMLFMYTKGVDTIQVAYFWTKDKVISRAKDVLRRGDTSTIWADFVPRLERYQEAFDEDHFPPRKNNFCAGCPVKSCVFWEPRKPR